MQSFEFIPHTADIAVRLRASSANGLFETAAAATTEALTDAAAVRPVEERRIELASTELELLLVDWLHELLFLFETEDFLVSRAQVTIHGETIKDTRELNLAARRDLPDRPEFRGEYVARACVRGERRDQSRHRLKLLIKAVTYHGLRVTQTAGLWEATVVFDI